MMPKCPTYISEIVGRTCTHIPVSNRPTTVNTTKRHLAQIALLQMLAHSVALGLRDSYNCTLVCSRLCDENTSTDLAACGE